MRNAYVTVWVRKLIFSSPHWHLLLSLMRVRRGGARGGLRQRAQGRRSCCGHADALGQGRQRPAGRIPQGRQRRLEHGEQNVQSLIGFTLPQPKQAPVDYLQGVGFQVHQHEE